MYIYILCILVSRRWTYLIISSFSQSKSGNGVGSNDALSTDCGSITTNPAFRMSHQASFRSTVSDSEVEQGNVSIHNIIKKKSTISLKNCINLF